MTEIQPIHTRTGHRLIPYRGKNLDWKVQCKDCLEPYLTIEEAREEVCRGHWVPWGFWWITTIGLVALIGAIILWRGI